MTTDYRDKKRHLDHLFSTDFNVFKVFSRDEKNLKEKNLSAVIATLLNPSGSHGQGRIFLDAFLTRIERYDLLTQEPRAVTCEAPTDYIENSNRWIDILVDFGKFGFAIENKPWASDQERQLNDYIKYLQRRYKDDRFCLLYITPEGGDPSEISIPPRSRIKLKEKGQLICVSYRHDILEWVRECCQLCESDKVRWFLHDFMDYVLDTFPSPRYQQWGCEIIKYRFLNKLKERFICLDGNPEASQWHMNHNESLLEDPAAVNNHFSLIKNSWGDRYGVGFQRFQRVKFQPLNTCIGVWKVPHVESVPDLKEALNREILEGEDDKEWEWYVKLESPYDNLLRKKALIKIYSGEAVEYFAEYIERIIHIAEPIIDKYVEGS